MLIVIIDAAVHNLYHRLIIDAGVENLEYCSIISFMVCVQCPVYVKLKSTLTRRLPKIAIPSNYIILKHHSHYILDVTL